MGLLQEGGGIYNAMLSGYISILFCVIFPMLYPLIIKGYFLYESDNRLYAA